MRTLACCLHPNKPANKMCFQCKRGFCKYDNLNYIEDRGFICSECEKFEPKPRATKIL